MNKHNNSKREPATPGFAIRIHEDTQLGVAMLIAETEAAGYRPVNIASSISEAKEMAAYDEAANPGCKYKVWARGIDGNMALAAEWEGGR